MQQPSSQLMDQDARGTTFSDEDDARLFESCGDAQLVGEILRIKRNNPNVNVLYVRGSVNLDDVASRRLGDIIGQSTHLEVLLLSCCVVEVEAMCAGLQNNKSIQKFRLVWVNLQSTETMTSLVPFLTQNPCLKEITLNGCRLEQASIDILANALSNGAGSNLEELNLSGNPIGDSMDGFIEALSESRCLTELLLSDCGIGPRVCASLAALMENPVSNLTVLLLEGNSIQNESTITLADSLVCNKKLQVLHLAVNDGITAEGWLAMLQLVCNCSSMKGVVKSNHVLRSLGSYRIRRGETVEPWGGNLRDDDVNLLRASLRLNRGENKLLVTRRKIIWGHARGDLNIGEVAVAAGTMPRLLAWFGDGSNESDAETIQYHEPPLQEPEIGIRRLGGVYRILLSMPDLCNRERDENAIAQEPQALGGAKRKRAHT